mmetsp:Transcript_15934/g.60723  ORF Transcript_15934/g.60723 Transcript_15934/m.60723 type:complete len:550 (+) Transcript_15934:416-2065(+)
MVDLPFEQVRNHRLPVFGKLSYEVGDRGVAVGDAAHVEEVHGGEYGDAVGEVLRPLAANILLKRCGRRPPTVDLPVVESGGYHPGAKLRHEGPEYHLVIRTCERPEDVEACISDVGANPGLSLSNVVEERLLEQGHDIRQPLRQQQTSPRELRDAEERTVPGVAPFRVADKVQDGAEYVVPEGPRDPLGNSPNPFGGRPPDRGVLVAKAHEQLLYYLVDRLWHVKVGGFGALFGSRVIRRLLRAGGRLVQENPLAPAVPPVDHARGQVHEGDALQDLHHELADEDVVARPILLGVEEELCNCQGRLEHHVDELQQLLAVALLHGERQRLQQADEGELGCLRVARELLLCVDREGCENVRVHVRPLEQPRQAHGGGVSAWAALAQAALANADQLPHQIVVAGAVDAADVKGNQAQHAEPQERSKSRLPSGRVRGVAALQQEHHRFKGRGRLGKEVDNLLTAANAAEDVQAGEEDVDMLIPNGGETLGVAWLAVAELRLNLVLQFQQRNRQEGLQRGVQDGGTLLVLAEDLAQLLQVPSPSVFRTAVLSQA